jgi:hypothetical protein
MTVQPGLLAGKIDPLGRSSTIRNPNGSKTGLQSPVYTENAIRVDDVMESPKVAE